MKKNQLDHLRVRLIQPALTALISSILHSDATESLMIEDTLDPAALLRASSPAQRIIIQGIFEMVQGDFCSDVNTRLLEIITQTDVYGAVDVDDIDGIAAAVRAVYKLRNNQSPGMDTQMVDTDFGPREISSVMPKPSKSATTEADDIEPSAEDVLRVVDLEIQYLMEISRQINFSDTKGHYQQDILVSMIIGIKIKYDDNIFPDFLASTQDYDLNQAAIRQIQEQDEAERREQIRVRAVAAPPAVRADHRVPPIYYMNLLTALANAIVSIALIYTGSLFPSILYQDNITMFFVNVICNAASIASALVAVYNTISAVFDKALNQAPDCVATLLRPLSGVFSHQQRRDAHAPAPRHGAAAAP